VVPLDGAKPGVVGSEREVQWVAGQLLIAGDGGEQLAHESCLARDGVGWVERVAETVAVAVDALTRPGSGQELREALGAGAADGLRVPVALGVELGGEHGCGGAGAGLGRAQQHLLVGGRDGAGSKGAGYADPGAGGVEPAAEQDQQQDDEQDGESDDRSEDPAQQWRAGRVAGRCCGEQGRCHQPAPTDAAADRCLAWTSGSLCARRHGRLRAREPRAGQGWAGGPGAVDGGPTWAMQKPLSLAAAAGSSARAATHRAAARRSTTDVEAAATGCAAASAPRGAGGCKLIPGVGAFAGQSVTDRRHDLPRCSAGQGSGRASVALGSQRVLPARRAGRMESCPRACGHDCMLRRSGRRRMTVGHQRNRRPPDLLGNPGQLIRHVSPRRLANYPCPGVRRVVVRRQFVLPAVNGQGCRSGGQGSELLTAGIGQDDGQGSVSSVASTCC